VIKDQTDESNPAKGMKEKVLEENVRQACLALGLLRYHTYRSTRSAPGFPDDVIVGRYVMFRELKTQRGKLTQPQAEWVADLASTGADVKIWRPSDWVDGTILAELRACAGGDVSRETFEWVSQTDVGDIPG
jgi:hypothetical protein